MANSNSTSGGDSAEVGSSGDLDQLLHAERQGADGDARVDVDAEPLQLLLGDAIHRRIVDQPEPVHRLHAQHDILRHRQVADDREFLVHHADPGGLGVARRAEPHALSGDAHVPLIFRMHAGDDLHRRALAGAVLADQTMDFTRAQGEIHVGQRGDAAERLRDAPEFEQGHPDRHGSRRHRWVGAGVRSGSVLPSTSCPARWPWSPPARR
jgi:hypothetical protein